MTDKKRPRERGDKVEADDAASLDSLQPSPMQRFKSLARRLSAVPKAAIDKEHARYDSEKKKRKR